MKNPIAKFKQWLRDQIGLTALERQVFCLEHRVQEHRRFVTMKIADLKKYTRVDADIGIRGNNTIILTGIYRGQAYVRFYDVGNGEFKRLVDQVHAMKDHCLIRNIDQPPSFHGMFDL